MTAPTTPPRVEDVYAFWMKPPPEPSARSLWWALRIKNGWKPNKRVRAMGYADAAKFFGVYVWEYQHELQPLIDLAAKPSFRFENNALSVRTPTITRCRSCLYMRLPHDGGHCYMFRTEPVPCAQWTTTDETGRPVPPPRQSLQTFRMVAAAVVAGALGAEPTPPTPHDDDEGPR